VEASTRQFGLLGAILVVLAVVLYWQSTRQELTPEEYSAAMSQRTAAAPGVIETTPSGPARPRAASPELIPAVDLAKLDRAQPEPSDSGRDPFRFESAPAAPRASQPAPQPGMPGAPQPGMPVAPQAPPGPPPIQLRFIGIAKQGQGRLYAVLRDERGVYYGAAGDVVEGRYRILRVSADAVEVSYADGSGRMSIPLSGGRP
jgi:hypothetical protein